MNYDSLMEAHRGATGDGDSPRVIGWVRYDSCAGVEFSELDLGGWGGGIRKGHRWADYIADLDERRQPYFEALRADILARHIRRGGDWHQNDPGGVPVFDDGCIVALTYRAWGDLMAALWATQDGCDYEYMDFYMDGLIPEG
jgi:hypothetical protein